VRIRAVVFLLVTAAVNLAGQPSAAWRFWDTADGYVQSYTSSVALNPDGAVWVKHGLVGQLELLNGYSAPKKPEPGGNGQLEVLRTVRSGSGLKAASNEASIPGGIPGPSTRSPD
jgi:hypothetical protein